MAAAAIDRRQHHPVTLAVGGDVALDERPRLEAHLEIVGRRVALHLPCMPTLPDGRTTVRQSV
jgi:hypothetical protein